MKTCFIMRGCSGSGKSTVANQLVGVGVICSADDFFVDPNGVYTFEKDRLTDAHRACWNGFQGSIYLGASVIVVDNTNTTEWEWSRYSKMADESGYEVVFVDFAVNFDPVTKEPYDHYVDTLHQRNRHGVPRETILKQCKNLIKERGF